MVRSMRLMDRRDKIGFAVLIAILGIMLLYNYLIFARGGPGDQ